MGRHTNEIAHVSPRPTVTGSVRRPRRRGGLGLSLFSFVAAASFVVVTVVDPTSGAVASPNYQATVQELTERHAQSVTLDSSPAAAAVSRDTFSVIAPPPPPPPPVVKPAAPAKKAGGGFVAPVFAAPSPGTSKAIAYDMVLARGWGEDQYSCLESLWQKESGWRVDAMNRSSGAYGIPQSLPGSKMASAGADWATNPATQITWGLGYITARYGTPCGAWATSEAKGWY